MRLITAVVVLTMIFMAGTVVGAADAPIVPDPTRVVDADIYLLDGTIIETSSAPVLVFGVVSYLVGAYGVCSASGAGVITGRTEYREAKNAEKPNQQVP